MAQNRDLTFSRLDEIWADARTAVIVVDDTTKLAFLSDLHLGDGGDADDIHHNADTLVEALGWYREEGFRLVLLGDIEELWQFELDQVVTRYGNSVYAALRQFPAGAVHRVFGNHDIEWQCPSDPIAPGKSPSGYPEALKLEDAQGTQFALLVHGHQGSVDSDRNSWISRFFVRGLWKAVEPLASKIGLYRHPAATKSMVVHDYEQVMYAWAKARRRILVCGHSHRAVCGSRPFSEQLQAHIKTKKESMKAAKGTAAVESLKQELLDLENQLEREKGRGRDIGPLDVEKNLVPCYFNTGCGLYADGLTAIELIGDQLALVKWSNRPVGVREGLMTTSLSDARDKVGC